MENLDFQELNFCGQHHEDSVSGLNKAFVKQSHFGIEHVFIIEKQIERNTGYHFSAVNHRLHKKKIRCKNKQDISKLHF